MSLKPEKIKIYFEYMFTTDSGHYKLYRCINCRKEKIRNFLEHFLDNHVDKMDEVYKNEEYNSVEPQGPRYTELPADVNMQHSPCEFCGDSFSNERLGLHRMNPWHKIGGKYGCPDKAKFYDKNLILIEFLDVLNKAEKMTEDAFKKAVQEASAKAKISAKEAAEEAKKAAQREEEKAEKAKGTSGEKTAKKKAEDAKKRAERLKEDIGKTGAVYLRMRINWDGQLCTAIGHWRYTGYSQDQQRRQNEHTNRKQFVVGSKELPEDDEYAILVMEDVPLWLAQAVEQAVILFRDIDEHFMRGRNKQVPYQKAMHEWTHLQLRNFAAKLVVRAFRRNEQIKLVAGTNGTETPTGTETIKKRNTYRNQKREQNKNRQAGTSTTTAQFVLPPDTPSTSAPSTAPATPATPSTQLAANFESIFTFSREIMKKNQNFAKSQTKFPLRHNDTNKKEYSCRPRDTRRKEVQIQKEILHPTILIQF